jgi:phosphohistidine phosphatase
MKTLLIIRHAKSGWDDPSLSDFERVLTERVKSDAAMMAKRIKKKSIKIDAFISSPAVRAKRTAEIFMKEYKEGRKKLLLIPALYEASVHVFYEVMETLDNHLESVALFSHNPGVAEFVNSLECSPVDNMPTCAVFALKIKTRLWKDLRIAEKEFLFFDYPKSSQ